MTETENLRPQSEEDRKKTDIANGYHRRVREYIDSPERTSDYGIKLERVEQFAREYAETIEQRLANATPDEKQEILAELKHIVRWSILEHIL